MRKLSSITTKMLAKKRIHVRDDGMILYVKGTSYSEINYKTNFQAPIPKEVVIAIGGGGDEDGHIFVLQAIDLLQNLYQWGCIRLQKYRIDIKIRFRTIHAFGCSSLTTFCSLRRLDKNWVKFASKMGSTELPRKPSAST